MAQQRDDCGLIEHVLAGRIELERDVDLPRRFRGTIHGPLTLQEVRLMATGGRLGPGDMVRQGEAGRWVQADTVEALAEAFHEPRQAPAREAGDDIRHVGNAASGEWSIAGLVLAVTLMLVSPLTLTFIAIGLLDRPNNNRGLTPVLLFFSTAAVLFLGDLTALAFSLSGLIIAFPAIKKNGYDSLKKLKAKLERAPAG